MYISKNTKNKDLPLGYYFLKCENYIDKNVYWIINRKIAIYKHANCQFDLTHYKINLHKLPKNAVYKLYKIDINLYKLYNINI